MAYVDPSMRSPSVFGFRILGPASITASGGLKCSTLNPEFNTNIAIIFHEIDC